MTTVAVDIERLVSDYLRSHADIVALSTRVVGRTPDDKSSSWIRVTELDAPDVNFPARLIESMVQFDIYAGATGGQPEVNRIYSALRNALTDLPGSYSLGVVTGVRFQGGPRADDTTIEPARQRKIATAFIWNHA